MRPARRGPRPGAGVRAWSLVVEAARTLLPLAALGSRKLSRGVAARTGAVARLGAWAASEREPGRPVVWLHGASAGELLGALPAVERLRARRDVQLVVTWFSPSAEAAVPALSPDISEALPLDTLRDTGRALDAVRPGALVFARGDVWPGIVAAAASRGIPLGLVNGTVTRGSSRLHWPACQLLAGTYARLDLAGAVSEDDARRLLRLGARPGAVVVTGDAAFDRAAARIREAHRPGSAASGLLAALGLEGEKSAPADAATAGSSGAGASASGASVPVLLGGSTWPRDEDLLLEAVAAARRGGHSVAVVLVPHEPGPEAIDRLSRACLGTLGVRPRLWSEVGGGGAGGGRADSGQALGSGQAAGSRSRPGSAPTAPPPVVVDRVGLLAGLYAFADLAYVGGGLGADGLHSVVEPAAAGIPVLFGPRHDRREADDLLERGGALEVLPATAPAVVGRLLADPDERSRRGAAARAYVEEGRGAAERSADLVERLLERSG